MSNTAPKNQRKLIPKRRFPEFKNALEWEEKPLSEVGEIVTGSTPSTLRPENYSGKWLFVSPADISDQRYIEKTKTTLSEQGFKETRPIKANSILFVCIGSTIGKIAQNLYECATNQQINSIIPNEKYSSAFIYFNLENISDRIAKLAGRHAVPIINKTTFASVMTEFPTLPEQQKIADCLSSLESLISAESQKLEHLQSHKKGLMQQLFPTEGETVPKLRFPEFEGGLEWETCELSKLVESLDAGVSVNSGDRPAKSGEVGILKTSALTNGIFESSENKVVYEKVEIQRLRESVRKDTIIISRMNTPALVGANAYVDDNFENIFLPDRLWAAKPKPRTSMRFIAFILGSGKTRAALSELATGTSNSMKNITKSDLLSLQIVAPSQAEQQKIANCLSSLDNLIAAQKQKINFLKTHKKGLMQQLFPAPDTVQE